VHSSTVRHIFWPSAIKIMRLIDLLLASAVVSSAFSVQFSQKSYSCIDGACQLNAKGVAGLAHGICLTTCGAPNLWPYPSGDVVVSSEFADLAATNGIVFSESDVSVAAFQRNFLDSIAALGAPSASKKGASTMSIDLEVSDHTVTLPSTKNDESYELKISTKHGKVSVSISGQTKFGVRHGLETLSQLISYDYFTGALVVPTTVSITDKPLFPYRGVMVDVSRNFMSIDKLKETVRAMGYNKMNVLHLHLSDTASFPLELFSQPNVTLYGAYDAAHVYSRSEISEFVAFAHSHGVSILPEIDMPAHVSAGWQWGADAGLGEFALCADPDGTHGTQFLTDSLEPPSGQLNVVNENVYPVLQGIYNEVIEMFNSDLFHLGGDEVIVGSDEAWAACYNSTTLAQPILAYLDSIGRSRDDPETFYELWDNFTMRATSMVQEVYATQRKNDAKDASPALNKIHVWGGGGADKNGVTYNMMLQPTLTTILPPSLFTVQVWDTTDDSITKTLIGQGYDVILSNTDYVYLDCGNAGFTNAGGYWCQPYHEWFKIYEYIRDVTDAWGLSAEELSHVQGSETLIWSEMVDDVNLSQKLWPRSAALAEALWTGNAAPARPPSAAANTRNKEKKQGAVEGDEPRTWFDAAGRMLHWRELLVARGIAAEALMPRWCSQRDPYACYVDAGVPQ
jgi:hexosaminidase